MYLNTTCIGQVLSVRVVFGVDIMLTITLLTTNVFILYATARFRRRQMTALPLSNKPAVILIMNLSAADLVVAVFYVYIFVPRYLCAFYTYLEHHMILCILRNTLVNIGHFASMFTLVAIAVDRYTAIVYCLRYEEIMSIRRTLLAIGTIWTVATFQATLLLYWNHWRDGLECEVLAYQPKLYDIFVVTLNVVFVVISMAVIYWKIGRIRKNILFSRGEASRRTSLTLLLILVVFTVCWIPHLSSLYFNQFGYNVPTIMLELASIMAKVNYVANPFIYALNTRPIRYCLEAAFGILKKGTSPGLGRNSSPQITSISY